MTPVELVVAALRGLGGNVTRSLLTLLMIVIGVGSVITLVAVGNGATKQVNDQISSLGASAITIYPGFSAGDTAGLTMDDAAALRSSELASHLDLVAPQMSAQKTASAGSRSRSVTVTGTTPDYFTIVNASLREGRLLTASDTVGVGNVAVIDALTEQALFPSGDAVGQTILVGSTPLRVVGVLTSAGGQSAFGATMTVFAPIDRVRSSISGYGALSGISLGATSPAVVDDAVREAKTVLAARSGKPLDPNAYTFSTPKELRAALGGSNASLSSMLAGVAAISLIVGGIGVTNVMLLTVRERTREIGIRKALGARGGSIAGQFMLEATILSLCGGAIGVLVSLAISHVPINGIPPLIEPSTVALAAGLSVGIGVVFGTYPAIRASRMDPVQALRVGM